MLLIHSVVWQHLLCECRLNHPELVSLFVLVKAIIVLNRPQLAELGWMVLHVRVDHESSESIVVVFADFVLDDGEEVESGKNGGSQVDIVVEI